MDVNIEDLKQWLHKHKEEFPEKSPKKRTLMDIIGVAELENQWSYLYLFFFNEDGEHGLRDLFIRSLECVINEEEGWLKNFYVFREVDIRKKHVSDDIKNPEDENRGRIDLLLLGEDKKSIIIENKVHHNLQGNPLKDYADYVKKLGCDPQKMKKIVLAVHRNYADLKRAKDFSYNYITHIDFVNEIEKRLPIYSPKASDYYLQLLHHFIQNIKNVTFMTATNEEMKFFFKNYDCVNRIHGVYTRVLKEYKSTFEEKENLHVLSSLRLKPEVRSIDDKELVYLQYDNSNFYLTILLNDLWNMDNPSVRLMIEYKNDVLLISQEKEDRIRLLCKELKVTYSNLNNYKEEKGEDEMETFCL